MKLAILSDTHGLLRPEVTEHLKTADAILHGGDINRQSIVDELRQYAPLYIVRGNNDKDWAEAIPHDLTVTLGGVTFFMVHNRKEVPADLAGVDAVVFGHSHRYVQEERDGVLWINAKGSLYMDAAAAPTLFTGSGASYTTIQADGYARWYQVGDAAGKTMTVQVPENSGFWVYDGNGQVTASSVLWGDTTVTLPEDGTIVFAGDPGARFHLRFQG